MSTLIGDSEALVTDDPPIRLTREMLESSRSAKMNVFRRMDLDAVWPLLEDSEVRILPDGRALLEMQQENRTMYMVLSGKLKVYLDTQQQKEVAVLEPGQTVGELSVIEASQVSARVCASGITSVLCIDEDTFWQLIRESHEFCTNLLLLLSARMRSNNFSLVESERLQIQFEKDSVTDGLTGVYNRRWLDKKIGRLLQRSQMGNRNLSVLMLDVDHFKRFNDTYGHQTGDVVLRRTAGCLSERLRAQDLVARYGGEEFCVLLPETNLDEALTTAKHLLNCVAEMEVTDSDGKILPPLTVSIGVACCNENEDATSLLLRADKALYRAKQNGRNRVELSE